MEKKLQKFRDCIFGETATAFTKYGALKIIQSRLKPKGLKWWILKEEHIELAEQMRPFSPFDDYNVKIN